MATPARLRRDLGALTTLAAGDLDVIWRQVSSAALAAEALNDVLPALVTSYGAAAAALAADWYDDFRDASGVKGRFTAVPIDIPDPGTGALVGWATQTATDITALQTLIGGGLQRRILNHSRGTLLQSTDLDPYGTGWIRVGHGECDWCKRYLDGEVHKVEGYDFDAHDWCKCDVEPVYA